MKWLLFLFGLGNKPGYGDDTDDNARVLSTHRARIFGALFCLVCVIYIAQLVSLEITGLDRYGGSDGTTTREVTVAAPRGQICDRNGKVVVGNEARYSLVLRAAAIPDSVTDTNRMLLQLLDVTEAMGILTPGADLFPFVGKWGDLSYSPSATDPNSKTCTRLLRLLDYLGKKSDTSAEDLVKVLTKRYQLDAKENGEPVFSDAEKLRLLRIRYDLLLNQFSTLNDYVFAEDLEAGQVTVLEELHLPGVTTRTEWVRKYNYPGYASHILGTVGKIRSDEMPYYDALGYPTDALVGHDGVEETFEALLHGTDGVMRLTEDAAGNLLAAEVLQEPVPGKDVILTIDIDVQISAEDGLTSNIDLVTRLARGYGSLGAGCDSGASVVMDPDTFEVLAIASAPTYDLTRLGTDYAELVSRADTPLYNRALLGLYAPGSTFKLGVAAAALTNGTIAGDTSIYTSGAYYFTPSSKPQNCWIYKDSHEIHGWLDVVGAIRVSCNYFFFEVGRRLGIEQLYPYMYGLGLGQASGIELTERVGTLDGPPTNTKWAQSEILNASIGQGTNAFTPLQICSYLCALWNGGYRYNAHILRAVYDPATGETVPGPGQELLSSVELSEENLAVIREGMRQVIEENAATVGTYLSGLPEDVSVWGKTGTAEIAGQPCENALFACVAERGDDRLVILTLLEEGYSGRYASYTASRVLKEYYK